MKVLCIDVGRGTRDILLYDSEKSLENCISLVIPSRGLLLEEALRRAIAAGKTPLFWGINMGGFPVFKHTRQFLQKGGKILATPRAAKTFHDNLDILEEKGFRLVSDQEAEQLKDSPDISALETGDIDWDKLQTALVNLGDDGQIDGMAVAVQDHGEAPAGVSNRQFRFSQHRQILKDCQHISQLAFRRERIPKAFTRMQAVADSLPGDKPLLLLDTGWAAILGALEDPQVGGRQRKLVVNLGNAHTLAALLEGDKLLALWEHHTACLDSNKLQHLLTKLAEGTIDHEEVFADGGHGAYLRGRGRPLCRPSGGGQRRPPVQLIALTGPNRMRFATKDYYLAAPYGNMMLSGAFGLLRAYQENF